MSACMKCGHNPEERVLASWSTNIDREIQSGNGYVINSGASRWKYAKTRDAWQWLFRAMRINQRIPRALTRRRVTITRHYDGRQRELDADNFATGAKLVLDAMVREGLLVDDRREFAEIHYEQVRQSPRATLVLLEELASDARPTSDAASAPPSVSSETHTERSPFVRESDKSLKTGPDLAGGR